MRIKVGAISVVVIENPLLRDCYAIWSPDGGIIEIGPLAGDPSTTLYTTTLLHELIHVLDSHNGLELTEQQTKCIEQGVTALFLDNPRFRELYFNSIRNFPHTKIDPP